MLTQPAAPASQRIGRAARLGAFAGAIGAMADGLTAAFLPYTGAAVRAQVAAGCAIMDVLAGLALATLLGAVWVATESLGRRLHDALPRVPAGLARTTPLAALLALWLAYDAHGLFAGPGVSRTALGAVGRWALPLAGAPLGVAALRGALAVHRWLRGIARAASMGALALCLAAAALFLHEERLPLLEPYFAVRRYCDVGALLAVLFGLSLFDDLIVLPARLRPRPWGRRLAAVLGLLAMDLTLPFLLPSSGARLAVASGRFIATPAVHGLRHLVDLDRDGYSPLLGGGDCNDLDRTVHPFLRDPPGDGIDQDCDGVDGWTPEPDAPDPAPSPSDAQAMGDLRARARGTNVLVVLVDALRFDRLQDPRAAASPRLAHLSRESVSFARALSPASRTPLAIPAILDGRPGGPGNRLFQAFHAAGARAAFVSIDVVLDQLHLAERLDREVDLVGVPTEGERSVWGGGVHVFTGGAITEAALRWVDARPGPPPGGRAPPWLLWVHYFGAHQWDAIDSIRSIPDMPRRYDAALADDDRAVGALLDGLAARGLSESTTVVLLADHGEALGDHGLRTHGWYLYPELVHVPMSLLVPGARAQSVPTVVSTAALTPTLLDLAGIAAPQDGGDASLVPLMAGATPPPGSAPRAVVMQDTFQSALAQGQRLLRFTPGENATELFALEDLDQPHPDDLAAREPDTAVRMSRALVSHLPR